VLRSREWRLAALLLTVLVIARAFPFVWWPSVHFDSDQAIIGLMAKHVSEGRAFPLYFYGQSYMLGVEAWLAAPVMWALGPTVLAVKAPLVAINVAVVLVFLRIATTTGGLRPSVAAVAALPLALPAAGLSTRLVEANGGNVEPWLYVLLLWLARDRTWALALVLGFASVHRELALYGAAALVVLDLLAGRAWNRAWLTRWSVAAASVLVARLVAATLLPFSDVWGPGTAGTDVSAIAGIAGPAASRLCFEPAVWPARAAALAAGHWPRLLGSGAQSIADFGVRSAAPAGHAGVAWWVLGLCGMGLMGGGLAWWTGRGRPAPDAHFAGYLSLVGLISTLVYGFGTCSEIQVTTLRYDLLGIMLPTGLILMGLQAWQTPAARAGLCAGVAVWCLLNLADVFAVTREYLTSPPPDQRKALAAALERRGVGSAWADLRLAYHVTFLASERVRLSPPDYVRIWAYADEAQRTHAPTVTGRACEGGVELVPRVWLCE
jgi:hypothetical protein